MRTAFIGGGNMATALISGLDKKRTAAQSVRVSDPSLEVQQRMADEFGIICSANAAEAVQEADAVLLAVKPQIMPVVLPELANALQAGQLVISVAAGVTVSTLHAALGQDTPVVRTMPNTPALLGQGITGLYAGPGCTEEQTALAESIMQAVGATVWVHEEALMDVVTAVSGSGPAYYYLLTEALRDAGAGLGLPPDVAAELALHTAHGAGLMAAHSGVDVAELRHRVTSPGGTTQAALDALRDGGFLALIDNAVQAATQRGRELAGPQDESREEGA